MCNSYNHTVIDSVTTGSAPGKPTAFVLSKWSPGMDSFNPLCIYLLVGGFKHFLLCIIYRIILPIGVHIMKMVKTPNQFTWIWVKRYQENPRNQIRWPKLNDQHNWIRTQCHMVPNLFWNTCRKSSCKKNKNMVSGFDFPWNQSIDWLYILIL